MHLTAKDFKVEWYSGTGKGGQHRNKHANCCRITHIASGLTGIGTESRSRVQNQRRAFQRLANKIIATMACRAVRRSDEPVIRNYHACRNEVHDKASGLRLPYKTIIGDISPMIEARRRVMASK